MRSRRREDEEDEEECVYRSMFMSLTGTTHSCVYKDLYSVLRHIFPLYEQFPHTLWDCDEKEYFFSLMIYVRIGQQDHTINQFSFL